MVTNSHYLKLPTSVEMIVINAYPSPKYNNRRQEDGRKTMCMDLNSISLVILYLYNTLKAFNCFYSYEF